MSAELIRREASRLCDALRRDIPRDRSEVLYFDDEDEYRWYFVDAPRPQQIWVELLPFSDDDRGEVRPCDVHPEDDGTMEAFPRIVIFGMPNPDARKLDFYTGQIERFLAQYAPPPPAKEPPVNLDPLRLTVSPDPAHAFPSPHSAQQVAEYALGRGLLWAMNLLGVRTSWSTSRPAVSLLTLAVDTYLRERLEPPAPILAEASTTSADASTAPAEEVPPLRDGDIVADGRAVYCQGLELKLTQQLRGILARVLKAPGIPGEALRKEFGLTNYNHLENRLSEIRKRARKELERRESPFRLTIRTVERRVYAEVSPT